ncbi:hypothetical protein Tco_0534168 [Tanacetum coccineum]
MENPNSPNESNEAIPEVNPVIPEPNHVEDAHDPNEMVDIPDDEELDIEDEDVEIEVDDAAELIFPYEVEGDQTSTPRDESSNSEPPNAESSDSVSSDSELEDKEADIAHRPTGGTATQRPFAIRDFPRGEKEKRYLIMDLGNVEKTLSNVVERLKILESEENATLKKKGFLDVFYGRWFLKEAVPEAALRYEDDGRPKEEVKEVGLRMNGPFEPFSRTSLLELYNIRWIMPPKPMSEARMREIIRDQVTTSMNEFMANMNHGAGGAGAGGARSGGAGAGGDGAGGAGAGGAGAGGAGAGGAGADGAGIGGAGPVEAEVTGCTYMTFMKCNPHTFKGTEGAVGLCQWFEKLESVFRISDCREKDKVKFATATLQGRSCMTWWNRKKLRPWVLLLQSYSWAEVRKWMAEEFCPQSVLQRLEQELYNLKLKPIP